MGEWDFSQVNTKIFFPNSDPLTVNVWGVCFIKSGIPKPCLNGNVVFVNLDYVVRDLICMLCDSEVKISEVQRSSDQRLK